MVCDKCEEKLSKLVVPDKWTDGARNTTGGKDGGRKIGGNRLLKKRAERQWTDGRCALLYGDDAGICAMCGRKVLDTKEFNMSS
ncbi:Cysteine-rich pdz-binding protein, partial [Globisporangium splendens]